MQQAVSANAEAWGEGSSRNSSSVKSLTQQAVSANVEFSASAPASPPLPAGLGVPTHSQAPQLLRASMRKALSANRMAELAKKRNPPELPQLDATRARDPNERSEPASPRVTAMGLARELAMDREKSFKATSSDISDPPTPYPLSRQNTSGRVNPFHVVEPSAPLPTRVPSGRMDSMPFPTALQQCSNQNISAARVSIEDAHLQAIHEGWKAEPRSSDIKQQAQGRPPSPSPSETSSWNSLDEDPVSLKDALRNMVSFVPDLLYWPNLEVIVIILFAPGILFTAAQVFGDPYQKQGMHNAFAISAHILIFIFMLHEGLRISYFSWHYRKTLWAEADTIVSIEKMDDPLLKLLAKCKLVRPAARWSGSWAIPLADADEPSRSMRAFWSPLAPWWLRRGGDMYASLAWSWLTGANGTVNVGYQYLRMVLQSTFAAVAGLGVHAGRTLEVAVMLFLLQMILAIYCIFLSPATDRLESIVDGIAAILGAVHIVLRYVASALSNNSIMLASLTCLGIGTSLHIFFMLYSVIVAIWKRMQYNKDRAAAREKRLLFWEKRAEDLRVFALSDKSASEEEKKAVDTIQASARGWKDRQNFESTRAAREKSRTDRLMKQLEKKEGEAATVINKNSRARLSRRSLEMNKEKLVQERKQRLEREELERIAVEKYRQEKEERDVAATRITAQVRAQQAKRTTKVQRERIMSTLVIQALARGWLTRTRLARSREIELREKMAAIKLQAAIRGFVRRIQYLQHKRARAKVEAQKAAAARRRQKRERQMMAAARIGAYARGWKLRRKRELEARVAESAANLEQHRDEQRERSGPEGSAPAASPAAARASAPAAAPAVTTAAPAAAAPATVFSPRAKASIEMYGDDTDGTSHQLEADDLGHDGISEAQVREKAAVAAEARAQAANTRGQVGPTPKIKPKAPGGPSSRANVEVDLTAKGAWE